MVGGDEVWGFALEVRHRLCGQGEGEGGWERRRGCGGVQEGEA